MYHFLYINIPAINRVEITCENVKLLIDYRHLGRYLNTSIKPWLNANIISHNFRRYNIIIIF